MGLRIGIDARFLGSESSAGIGVYVEELVSNLLAIDQEDTFFLFTDNRGKRFFPFYAPNLVHLPLSCPHYSWREQFYFPFKIMSQKLDLMHYTSFNAPVIIHPQAKSLVTVHDLTLSFFPGRTRRSLFYKTVYQFVLRRSVNLADQLVVDSEYSKKDLIHRLKVSPSKIKVIYLAADTRFKLLKGKKDKQKVEALKDRLGITRPYLLYVGQWREHKNLPRLVQALGSLVRHFNFNIQLVLGGKKDVKAIQLFETIRKLELQDRVIMPGYVSDDDLPYLYNGAELFVFPSLYEGFGLPPLEAMACGVPVAAAKSSSLPEVLDGGAVFFDPLKVDNMVEVLAGLLNSFTLRHRLKEKGLKRAKKFSYRHMAEETLNLYRAIADKNGQG